MLRTTALCFIILALLAGCAARTPEPAPEPAPEPVSEAAPRDLPVAGLSAENYPAVDGSTANMPLMAHLYAKICGVSLEQAEARVPVAAGTAEAWRSLTWESGPGLIIAYEAPESIKYALETDGTELEVTPLGRDGLVFLVNKDNPVENLSVDQLRGVYSGEITDWSGLGGGAGPIAAYQRNHDSGSHTMFKKLLFDGGEPMEAPKELVSGSMGGLVENIADFDGSGAAIGYSVYYYADLMYANPNLKLLSVDGAAPSKETIGGGEYPLVNDFFAAIRASEPEGSPARLLYDWLISPEGAALLEEAGYVPAA